MAPLERRAQGLLARGRRAVAIAGKQLQPVLHGGRELRNAQQWGTRRRQFDGQRQSVELAAQLDGGRRRVVAENETSVALRARSQQRHCREGLRQHRRQRTLGHGQRANAVHVFGRQPQRRLAGDEQPQPRRRLE